MGEDAPVDHQPWGTGGDPVDDAIRKTGRAIFPLHGLDPNDPGTETMRDRFHS
jgi:acetoin utilization protein AcuC